MQSIRDCVLECLRGFTALRDALQGQGGPTSLENPPQLTAVALSPSQVQSEEARFKVWCGNIGAHQTGTRSSLEYRLRDASHIEKQVVRILASLSGSLIDARSLIVGETTPLEDELAECQDDDDDLPCLEDLGYESELVQIFASIVDSTTRLLRLSIAIRNPAPHDRFLRARATSTKHNEPWDIQHARDKFPHVDYELAERLGKAISKRRQYFKYRESHHDRLAHGMGQINVRVDNDEESCRSGWDDDDAQTRTIFSTVASSLPLHLRLSADDRPEWEPAVLDEDQTSEAGVSQTSFATSTSMPSNLRIPKLPAKATDGPFECQFCYMIVSAPNSRAWRRHVHADLQPYICLWQDCSTPQQQFQRRSHWLNHILQYHWRTWYCSLGCNHEFSERESIRSHILDVHPEAASSTSLDTLASMGEKPKPLNQKITCPLCHFELISITEYARHVGKHLVDVALFALPSGNVDGENDDKDAPESSSNSESDHESLGLIEETHSLGENSVRDVDVSQPEQPEDTIEDPKTASYIAVDNQHPPDALRSSRVLEPQYATASHGDLKTLSQERTRRRDKVDDDDWEYGRRAPIPKAEIYDYDDEDDYEDDYDDDDEDDYDDSHYNPQYVNLPPSVRYVPYQPERRVLSPIASDSDYTEGGSEVYDRESRLTHKTSGLFSSPNESNRQGADSPSLLSRKEDLGERDMSDQRHQNQVQNNYEIARDISPSRGPSRGPPIPLRGRSPPSPSELANTSQIGRQKLTNDLIQVIRTAGSGPCHLNIAQIAGEQLIAQPHMCPEGNECDRFKTLKKIVSLINQWEDGDGTKLHGEEIHQRLALLHRPDFDSAAPSNKQGWDPHPRGSSEMHRNHTLLDMSKPQIISLLPYKEAGTLSFDFNIIQRRWNTGSSPIPIGRRHQNGQIPSNDPLIPDRIGFKSRVVSREHCEVLVQDGRWYIRDMGSSTGTFLNSARISAAHRVSDLEALYIGDVVQLGINYRGAEENEFRCVRMRIHYETTE